MEETKNAKRYKLVDIEEYQALKDYYAIFAGSINTNYIKRELEICIDMLNRSGDNTKQKARIRLGKLLQEMER